MDSKKILARGIASLLIVAAILSFHPNKASALVPGIPSIPNFVGKPFGGKINFMLPCTCRDYGAILFVGDPKGGRFYYSIEETILFKNFLPIFTHWVLGLYDDNDKEWCKFRASILGIPVCIPYYHASIIRMMGTS